MAHSIGVHSKGRNPGTNIIATAAVNTTGGTGSVFLAGIVWFGTSALPTTLVDNASPPNAWVQMAPPVPFSIDANGKMVVYKCIGGVGKTGNIVTATFTDASGGGSMFFIELLGFTNPTIDQFTGASDLTNPFTSGPITTTSANDVLVGFTGTFQPGTESRTWAAGYTEVETYTNGVTDFTGGVAHQIVSAVGTYDANFTDSGIGGNTVSDEAVTWIVSVADGGSTTPVNVSSAVFLGFNF